jgi:hypothetical protein
MKKQVLIMILKGLFLDNTISINIFYQVTFHKFSKKLIQSNTKENRKKLRNY